MISYYGKAGREIGYGPVGCASASSTTSASPYDPPYSSSVPDIPDLSTPHPSSVRTLPTTHRIPAQYRTSRSGTLCQYCALSL
eukprot:3853616-Rhodomonas_salina.1